MENNSLLIVNTENYGYATNKYIGNTFIDPTHFGFRYTKIIYNKEKIAYHIWETGYLADKQASNEETKKNLPSLHFSGGKANPRYTWECDLFHE